MQKIRQKKDRKSTLLRIALLSFTTVSIFMVAAYSLKLSPFSQELETKSGVDLSEPTDEQKEAGELAKEEAIIPAKSPGTPPPKSPTPSEGTNNKQTVGVEITNINRSGGTLTIKALIQEVSSQGVCSLKLTQPGKTTITQTAKTQPLPSSSTCQGFTVSNLPSGTWKLTISYSSDKATGSVSESI